MGIYEAADIVARKTRRIGRFAPKLRGWDRPLTLYCNSEISEPESRASVYQRVPLRSVVSRDFSVHGNRAMDLTKGDPLLPVSARFLHAHNRRRQPRASD